jgi:aminopeptidase N
MARLDPHSYADDAQPKTRAFHFAAHVDFAQRTLDAETTLTFHAPASGGPLDLDTRGLTVRRVVDQAGAPVPFTLHPAEETLGARLELTLAPGTTSVTLQTRTAPDASALQWLDPAQTHGGTHPYLFSQCQAVHARSLVPCQDTPAIRVKYTAALTVPAPLTAVMAAATKAVEARGAERTFHFEMPQPIPPYLFAFAVGELAAKDLSPRSRVWAEPGMLEAAAWEFAEVEKHLEAAEGLFGPYDWERFDLLVMPPSFPYGGMENPRLTFLTPTLIAGDRSLVNVVAHELAHSWTGNLVTNANAEHFWLNEGFTVFAERRILERLEGEEMTALHAALGFKSLEESIARFAQTPELTKLRTRLTGVDPDEAFSQVPYEKGYLFLKALEAAAGRAQFDALLRKWLSAHRFGAVTTDDFLTLVGREAPGLLEQVHALEWIDQPGLPASFPRPSSARLQAIEALGAALPSDAQAKAWTPTEWQLYLEAMPRPLNVETLHALEAKYHLTAAKNAEVLVAWLVLANEAGLPGVTARTEAFLSSVGRVKYLRPLYKALASSPARVPAAKALFERLKGRYHPIAQQVIGGLLAKL